MLISVIIPTCNRLNLLRKCVESIVTQIFFQELTDKVEVIVADDSSNRETEVYIKSISHTFVSYVKGPEKGPAANRNNAAIQSSGEWLVFIDDDCIPDDMLLNVYLNNICKALYNQVFEGAVYPDRAYVSPLEHAPVNIEGGNLWSCNFCVSRKLFFSIGGFDEHFKYPHLEDVDLKERLLEKGKVDFLKDAKVIHPVRKNSNGILLGKYHESDYYYIQVKKKTILRLHSLIKNIVLSRLSPVKNFFWQKDSLIAVWVLIQELSVVLLNYSYWKRKYTVSE